MNRAKLIRFSVRLANSLSSSRQSGLHWVSLSQVTSQSPPFFLSKCHPSYYISPNYHQNLHFSSKTESFIDLILSSNDWSEEFENELEKLNPKITHESVVYVLMNLDRNPQKLYSFFRYACDRKGFHPSCLPYCLVLKSLIFRDCMEHFWVVASEMKEKGFRVDSQIYGAITDALRRENLGQMVRKWTEFYRSMRIDSVENDITKDVIDLILGSDWSKQVESKLEKLNFPLNDDFLSKVIWKLKDDPLKALKFFEWVASSLRYEHNSITYGVMAKVLAQRKYHGLIDNFWELMMRMRSEGHEIDNDLYVKITKLMGKGDAVRLFEFMMDSPYKLSEKQCVWLLKQLSVDSNPDMDLVNRVVNKYLEVGNTCTKAIYHGIHRSLCSVGRFDEANKIVDLMTNAGYKPDNTTYSQEVFGLCKLGRYEDARLVLNRMEAEGFVLDVKTWTILIQRYFEAGQMDQALSCFAQMLGKKLKPDATMLEVLIKGFLSQNELPYAYNFLVDMVDNFHLKPLHATYKLMIETLLQGGKLAEAFNVLSMMKQQKYPPNPEPFVLYISKFGTVEDARKFLRALPMEGFSSSAAYIELLSSFFEHGRHSEAKDLIYNSTHTVHNQETIEKTFRLAQHSSRS